MEPTKEKQAGDASSLELAANPSASPQEPPAARDARLRLQEMQLGDLSSSLPLMIPPQFQPQHELLVAQHYGVGERSSDAVYAWPVGDTTPSGDVIWGYVVPGPAFVPEYYGPLAPSYPSAAQWWSSAPSSSSGRYGHSARSRSYDTRATLLSRRTQDLALLMSPTTFTSREVIHELGRRNARVRCLVRDRVASVVHTMMESNGGRPVFIALLRACEYLYDDLRPIVEAACDGRAPLLRLMKCAHGKAALKELIRVAAPYNELYMLLINRLLRDEWMMNENEGVVLLDYLFTTLPYSSRQIIIQFAIDNFGALSLSQFGSLCLIKCFKAVATEEEDEQLLALEHIVSSQTIYLAEGRYSNLFLQRVLELGGDSLKDNIVERVLENLVRLSVHWPGNYVVQTCFLRTGRRRKQRVLAAFRGLGDDQLLILVQSSYAHRIVRKLLEAGENSYPEETVALAQRIKELLATVQRQNYYAWSVMDVVRKVLPQQKPQ